MALVYKRVVVKLSGETLGAVGKGIDPSRLLLVVNELKQLRKMGVEVAVVIGAGNIWRKRTHGQGIDGATSDYLGLLATVMNGLALQDALRRKRLPVILQSPVASGLPTVQTIDAMSARGSLRRGEIVVFAGGTGKPFYTTDTAAAIRAHEVRAELIIKTGPARGVYSADPKKFPKAFKYKEITLAFAKRKRLGVMDIQAFDLCLKYKIPVVVCGWQKGVLAKVVQGQAVGTILRP